MNLSTPNDTYEIYYNQVLKILESPLYDFEFYSKPKAMGEFEDELFESIKSAEVSFLTYNDFKKTSKLYYDEDRLISLCVNMLLREYENKWFSDILYG